MFVLGRISISCNLQVQYHKSGTNFTLLLLVVPILGDLFLIFRSLGAVFGTGLASVCNTCRIQRTSNDVVSGTGQILNSSATDQNNAMLLKVVTLSWDVACYFDTVGQTNSGDLSQC